jgi:hypothetical protein
LGKIILIQSVSNCLFTLLTAHFQSLACLQHSEV